MRRTLYFVLIALGMFMVTSLSAQSDSVTLEILELIEQAPPATQYPDASAMTLKHEQITRVNPDFSSVTDEHLVIKIINDLGKRRYGDQKRKYNVESDTIEVVMARTFDQENNIYTVEEKAINDITPSSLSGASMYSNIMQKVISFPALGKGVTIDLVLRTKSGAPDKDEKVFFWDTDLFQKEDPILSKKRQLILPLDVDIDYTFQNEGVSYTVDTLDNEVIHTWETDFASQIIPEPNMPPMNRIAPRLIYTSAESWNEVGAWFAEKFFKHIDNSPEMIDLVGELREQSENRADLIEEIGTYVIKNVREVNLRLGLGGYEPHDASEVLDNKYGDWRDKTVLMIAMLKEAGIEAYPVFVNQSDPVTAVDMPALCQYNALFVYVPGERGNDAVWINPFADYCRFGYFPNGQSVKSLLVRESGAELIEAYDPPHEVNLANIDATYDLDQNGDLRSSFTLSLDGYMDYRARVQLKNKKPVELEQYFQRIANNIGFGSRTERYSHSDPENLQNPMELSIDVVSPEIGVIQDEMMIFELFGLPFNFIYSVAPSLEMRFYDFMAVTDFTISVNATIDLPDGYRLAFVPDDFEMENEYVRLLFDFEQDSRNGVLNYTSTTVLKQKRIPADDYFEFKEMFDERFKRKNRIILLERISG